MFTPVGSKVGFPELEKKTLAFWQANRIFEKTVEAREGRPRFSFYEGPPTANGRPGIHHVLARVYKDVILRYRTMRGYYVPRKGGWDTHGLPVELEIERELNIASKPEIEAYGVAAFNARCKESVFRYVHDWEALTERIGYWIDMANAYVTYANEYIESGWWITKQLWERGFIYQDYKVTPHCPRCGTSLSSHEVALGYEENTPDPSVFVKFRVVEAPWLDELDPPVYMLAWTTTPWTLPGNAALAIDPAAEYSLMRMADGERLVLASARLDKVLGAAYPVELVLTGADLVGTRYAPLYDMVGQHQVDGVRVPVYQVVEAEFVSLDEGTGIVHTAPAYGEVDLELGRARGLPVIHTVDLEGKITPHAEIWWRGQRLDESEQAAGLLRRFAGVPAKKADPSIIDDLKERGLIYRSERILHTYPFCWRCSTPLLYYAKTSWYIRTTAKKAELVAGNEQISWYPEHIKWGRFGDWLEHNVDWAFSRERYWGTPMPLWRCDNCQRMECIGSVAELRRRSRTELPENLDLHRPYVDEVVFDCPECGGTMQRVPEVIDAWFDSGAMPVAQWHYPFENHDAFSHSFPADFICEAVDQTRGWFYSLHALSTLLFDQPCYMNVICLGLILDARGEKMSKSRGNVVDPWEVLNAHGADALRWYLFTASPPGNARRFSVDLVGEVVRKFMLTLWNTYSFFVTYANIDRFVPGQQPPAMPSNLDRWIIAELQVLIQTVTEAMDAYDPTTAARAIQQFVDDLSNWYVRRSRRRFWNSESDADKLAAYQTLYRCLVDVIKLASPLVPFVSEEIHQNLVRSLDEGAEASVHLCLMPQADTTLIDHKLIADTRLVMRVASLGRAAREKAGIKVRQPIGEVLVRVRSREEESALEELEAQVREELNVKRVRFVPDASSLVTYTIRPRIDLLGPKYRGAMSTVVRLLREANQDEVARLVRNRQEVTLGEYTLLPDEIEVVAREREGYAVSLDGDYAVGVATALSPELVQEGLARELVHRIQTMRRSADFRIEDHITTFYLTDPELAAIIERFAEYICQETLSDALVAGPTPADAYAESLKIEGHEIGVGVKRRGVQ
ncbi:MAG: isoleucine--tRNA ligase [Chloroflexi bacterium]|nr:isoleucine--tRNA ligase [Chloroflexota bacterium]